MKDHRFREIMMNVNRILSQKRDQSQNLIGAVSELHKLHPNEIPDHVMDEVEQIKSDLTAIKDDQRGYIPATVAQLNFQQVSTYIERIRRIG
jgi:hypothetical protein